MQTRESDTRGTGKPVTNAPTATRTAGLPRHINPLPLTRLHVSVEVAVLVDVRQPLEHLVAPRPDAGLREEPVAVLHQLVEVAVLVGWVGVGFGLVWLSCGGVGPHRLDWWRPRCPF